ncbi:MAG TPA: DUF433 domain-containing protein [Pyrinomonadaceae bacterium]|nr:DUF433 domain-containing protein [Pyrinomonadaceae bacterium]
MKRTQINSIRIDPEIMSGTPVFDGTRVPVRSLFDWLETETLDEFLDNFTDRFAPTGVRCPAFCRNAGNVARNLE